MVSGRRRSVFCFPEGGIRIDGGVKGTGVAIIGRPHAPAARPDELKSDARLADRHSAAEARGKDLLPPALLTGGISVARHLAPLRQAHRSTACCHGRGSGVKPFPLPAVSLISHWRSSGSDRPAPSSSPNCGTPRQRFSRLLQCRSSRY